eukprot:3328929-Rhodomonas_salina.4
MANFWSVPRGTNTNRRTHGVARFCNLGGGRSKPLSKSCLHSIKASVWDIQGIADKMAPRCACVVLVGLALVVPLQGFATCPR